MTAEPERKDTLAVDPASELVEQGKEIPGVAEALAVFAEASRRAPYIAPLEPEVRYSTGANS